MRVGFLLTLGIIAKFFVDTSSQLFNPYLLIYAAGIGVGGMAMGRLVSLRNLSGLIAPVIGSLADRFGYRLLMRINLLLVAAGLILFASGSTGPALYLGMVLWGIGQGGFAPNAHAYLSSRLPYEKRSRYLGMLEYSWAIAGILGLSLIGLLIARFGWRLPLYLLAGGLILSSAGMGMLPKVNVAHPTAGSASPSFDQQVPARPRYGRIRDFFYLGPHWPSAWGVVLVNFFNFFATFHLMITHGAYLELEYGLGAARLGAIALVLGLADWAGSFLVSVAGDRIGKRRSLIIGAAGMLLFFVLLPFLNQNFTLALVGLILPRFFFEFATVSNFPLMSEQYPAGRGKVLSLGVAGGLLGTTIAAVTGPAAYLKAGLWGLGPVSAAASLVSLLILIFIVRERSATTIR